MQLKLNSVPTNSVAPNLSLNSDPACVVFRSFSCSVFLGFVQRLGAGGAG